MRAGERPRSRQSGFTYFGVLVLVALIGLMLALAGEVAGTTARREKEVQLLFVGHAYRSAIASYYARHRQYPASLELLLDEPTGSEAHAHYLRQAYVDPMTGAGDWTWIAAPDGGIAGVASASTKNPIKTAGFDDEDVDFDKAASYADWKFVFDPRFVAPGIAGVGTPLPTH